jgi:hypothetical protein
MDEGVDPVAARSRVYLHATHPQEEERAGQAVVDQLHNLYVDVYRLPECVGPSCRYDEGRATHNEVTLQPAPSTRLLVRTWGTVVTGQGRWANMTELRTPNCTCRRGRAGTPRSSWRTIPQGTGQSNNHSRDIGAAAQNVDHGLQ